MKKAILCLVLLGATAASRGQSTVPAAASQQEYLQKSRNQQAGAWLLSGLGAACIAGAISYDLNHIFDATATNTTGFYVAGLTGIGSGIALFLASGRNRRKSRTLPVTPALRTEEAPLPTSAAIVTRSYPALALCIKL